MYWLYFRISMKDSHDYSQWTTWNRLQPRLYPGPRLEAFFYSFLENFAMRTASFKRWEKRNASLWSRPLGSSLLTVVSVWRIFLTALRVIWLNVFGDVISQKKMTSLTAFKCSASMKVRFSTILIRRLSFLLARRFNQRFASQISK